MARTKQTARKETGGKVPRKSHSSKSKLNKSSVDKEKKEHISPKLQSITDYNKMTVADLKKLLEQNGIDWKTLPKTGKTGHVKKDFVDALAKKEKTVKKSPVKEKSLVKSVKKSPVKSSKNHGEPYLPYDVIKYMIEMSDDFATTLKMCTSSKELMKHCDLKFWHRFVHKTIGENAPICKSIENCQDLILDYDILTKMLNEYAENGTPVNLEGIGSINFKTKKGKLQFIEMDIESSVHDKKLSIKEAALALYNVIGKNIEFMLEFDQDDYYLLSSIPFDEIRNAYLKAKSRKQFILTIKSPGFIWI